MIIIIKILHIICQCTKTHSKNNNNGVFLNQKKKSHTIGIHNSAFNREANKANIFIRDLLLKHNQQKQHSHHPIDM